MHSSPRGSEDKNTRQQQAREVEYGVNAPSKHHRRKDSHAGKNANKLVIDHKEDKCAALQGTAAIESKADTQQYDQ
jgi:hypothetical protein